MKVILVRHAKAMDRLKALLKTIADEERPLTKKGVKKFNSHLDVHIREFASTELFICSELLRAKQTLELILQKRPSKKPVTPLYLQKIGPEDSPVMLLKWLQARTEKKIVIVGHEPFISKFISKANGAVIKEKIKKGAIICTEINFSDDGQAQIIIEKILQP